MIQVIRIHPDDNVCVAIRPLSAGTEIVCDDVVFELETSCPLGAKLALRDLRAGEKVIKYGEPIGSLSADVSLGGFIHTHNLESDYLHTYQRGELVNG